MAFPFLLALQAAGMVTNWLGAKNQIEIGKMGAQMEAAGIEANIASSRLQAEDESLRALKELRMNLGSQAAILAARGVRSGAGSPVGIREESFHNFESDERMRRMNMLNREGQLRAGKTISQLHQAGTQAAVWGEFRNNTLSTVPGGTLSTFLFGSDASKKQKGLFDLFSIGV